VRWNIFSRRWNVRAEVNERAASGSPGAAKFQGGIQVGWCHHIIFVDVLKQLPYILVMDSQTEVKPTSTQRVIKHRAGLMTYVRELRAEVAEIRRDLAMLVETVRPPEQRQSKEIR
jgi:hypothetical protein